MKKLILFLLTIPSIYEVVKGVFESKQTNDENLCETHLIAMGWIKENDFFVERSIKDRDKIWVSFHEGYYRVFHGASRTFIALKKKKAWFDLYYSLLKD